MSSKRWQKVLALMLLSAMSVAVAQSPSANAPIAPAQPSGAISLPTIGSGSSTDLSDAFIAQKEKPFTYRPTDPIFWQKVETYRKEGNPVGIVVEGARQMESFGESTSDGAEGRLALAIGLRLKGFSHGALMNFVDLAQSRSGTSVGEAALSELALLVQEYEVDKEIVDHLLNSNEFGPLHPDIQAFVSYNRYLYDLRYGFKKWSKQERALIKPGTYWDYELQYWRAIGEVARGKIEPAEATFKLLKDDPKTPPRIRNWAMLQVARLLFERGQFEPAYALYRQLGELGVREKGRVLLEIAWTKYYMKDYSKSLGLLKALQAPYFVPSLSPERAILEIVIYRDLCHYEAVDDTVSRFKESFRQSIRQIRKRLPLREDPVLVNLALLDRDFQSRANLIDQLRRERDELRKYSWNSLSFFAPMLQEYADRDRFLQRELDIQLEPRTREIAEALLDTDEQVQFLDYTSKMDALRIVRAGEDRDYKSETISYLTFDRTFWPVENEFWWDEFDDFKMLISSRCNLSKSPADEKMEQEFQ